MAANIGYFWVDYKLQPLSSLGGPELFILVGPTNDAENISTRKWPRGGFRESKRGLRLVFISLCFSCFSYLVIFLPEIPISPLSRSKSK